VSQVSQVSLVSQVSSVVGLGAALLRQLLEASPERPEGDPRW